MIEIVSVVDEGLGHSSHVVGLADGRALVVDPARLPDRQRRLVAARGWERRGARTPTRMPTTTTVGRERATNSLLRVGDERQFVELLLAGVAPTAVTGAVLDVSEDVGVEPLTVMCGHGERAMTAARVLEARDHQHLSVVAGGPAEWAAATGAALVTGP